MDRYIDRQTVIQLERWMNGCMTDGWINVKHTKDRQVNKSYKMLFYFCISY